MIRRLPAILAMLALLFAQLTLAAYACPVDASTTPATAMTDCPGRAMPISADAVCEFSCEAGASVPGPVPRDIPILAAPALIVAVHAPEVSRYLTPAGATPRDTMATAPPVAIRFCRLLI